MNLATVFNITHYFILNDLFTFFWFLKKCFFFSAAYDETDNDIYFIKIIKEYKDNFVFNP